MYRITIAFVSFIFLTANLQAAPQLSNTLVSCLQDKSSQINHSNQERSLLAVSSCLSSFVQDLETKVNNKPIAKLASSNVGSKPSFIPSTSFANKPTQDPDSADSDSYGSRAGNEDDGVGNNVILGSGAGGNGSASGHVDNVSIGYQALYSLTDGGKNSSATGAGFSMQFGGGD